MSGISYGDGGTKRSISKVFYRDGATTRTIKAMWYGDGGTKRQVYSAYTPVSVVLNTYSISKFGSGTGATGPSGSTLPVTATASGGSGTITYSWVWISGDTGTNISATTGASVTFSRTSCADGATYNSVWRCTATDGTTSSYKDVSVALGYSQAA